jgi:glycosyltransferase involved in cell wall biosynthesis
MNQVPRVSNVVPSYNQGAFLGATIRSLLDQKYPDLEIIVIDGGSSDNSVDVIRQYADKLKYWVSEKDKGQSEAINKGFRMATGRYVNWLCSDDILLEDALIKLVSFMEGNPEIDCVFGNVKTINGNGDLIDARREIPYDHLITVYSMNHSLQPTALYKREMLDKVGLLDEGLQYSMDHDLFLRMDAAGCRFGYVNEFIAGYRYHSQSKGTLNPAKTLNMIKLGLKRRHGLRIRNRALEFMVYLVLDGAMRLRRKWRKFVLYREFSLIPFSWKIAYLERMGRL